jgi:hypothetical protein
MASALSFGRVAGRVQVKEVIGHKRMFDNPRSRISPNRTDGDGFQAISAIPFRSMPIPLHIQGPSGLEGPPERLPELTDHVSQSGLRKAGALTLRTDCYSGQ